jgi:hypothetical protein
LSVFFSHTNKGIYSKTFFLQFSSPPQRTPGRSNK